MEQPQKRHTLRKMQSIPGFPVRMRWSYRATEEFFPELKEFSVRRVMKQFFPSINKF